MSTTTVTSVPYAGTGQKATDRDFYGTPSEWIETCRNTMGHIELDPASWQEANDRVVHADRFFDKQVDALKQSWACQTLFLNPPYSNKQCTRLLHQFASKFHNEWSSGNIGQAIVLINNTTETAAFDIFSKDAAVHAQTRSRIQFLSVEGRQETSNPRGQVFFYYGRRIKRFTRLFKAMNCRVLREV
jgi:hypothetical protein